VVEVVGSVLVEVELDVVLKCGDLEMRCFWFERFNFLVFKNAFVVSEFNFSGAPNCDFNS
jgi:hypothetical protein